MNTLSYGVTRAARAMLRSLGGGCATLLVAQPAEPSEQNGLGIAVPPVNEIKIAPVLIQQTADGKANTALVDRMTIHAATKSAGFTQAEAMLLSGMLRYKDQHFRIACVKPVRFGCDEVMYELGIEGWDASGQG